MSISIKSEKTRSELEKAEWFLNVGTKNISNDIINLPINVVASWEEVAITIIDPEWDKVINESANLLRSLVQSKSKEEYRKWNSIAIPAKEYSLILVNKKISKIEHDYKMPQAFRVSAQSLITMIILEAEYQSPGNFSKLGFWIVNGHFPCGWIGDFPSGTLQIY